jgi:hypothetical protein
MTRAEPRWLSPTDISRKIIPKQLQIFPFPTSALKESWVYCLLSAKFIGNEDWMVNLMIIHINKIIAKALDFNDIFKKIVGMFAQCVQIS